MSGHGMKLEAAKFLMRIERSQRDLHAEKLRKLRNEKRAAEASLDALRAQVQPVVADMRTLAMVAGQASVEERDPAHAQADARFAEYATGWADRLAALLDPPSGAPQKKDDDQSRAGETASSGTSPYRTDRTESQS